ncbi:MAG: hypothetical protein IJS26_03465 [Alphaproteobacteria bacterium]|nr:hypothetical protein [Alphaproteobacteria bacterium]
MARRGSKYARKHFVETKEEKNIEREIAQKPHLEVIYDDVTFVETFHRLKLQDALNAYAMLIELSKEKNKNKESRSDARYKLEKINKSMGLYVVERDGEHLPKEEKLIVRMDVYGRIDRIEPRFREQKLSPYYRELMQKPLGKHPKMEDYDFENSPSWKLYARFQGFRKIEKELKTYLRRHKIDPQILKLMTPRDFSDLIVQTFQKDETERRVSFVSNCSVKDQFVKDIAAMHSGQIAEIWRKKGYDERYIRSQLNAMRRFGSTNSNKLIITEIYFTDRVLADLKAENLLYEGFEKGKKIPQHFVDYLIDEGLGDLIAARDEHGKKLLGSQFASYEVHHKYAVSEGGYLTNIAYANYRNNLCLVSADIHAKILHGNDQISDGKLDTYSRRTEFIDDDVCFMGGLEKSDQISHDFNKNKAKRMKKDDVHNVMYEDCMRELALNQRLYDECHRKLRFNVDEDVAEVNKFYQNRKRFAKKVKADRRLRKITNIASANEKKVMRAKLNMLMKSKTDGKIY